jgi:DNA-binding NtrC family response regulator
METQKISLIEESPLQFAFLLPASRGQGSAIELKEFFNIGRDPQNHLCLGDNFISSRHARIEKRGTNFILRDLQSRNGTFLNGSRILEANLKLNDQIQIGESFFTFAETSQENANALTSRNSKWNQQLLRAPAFASTDFAVLITGPSGSGKEIIANWIHKASTRQNGPFISINCSALSASLIESELFGHKKGSFTGATEDRKGAFESARGGTLFLDEIGDLPIDLQPKLLRALENQEIKSVGSDRTIKTNVRIIAATHKNLVQNVQQKSFREDLYFRLNVCHIQPPALIDRMEDFDDLIYGFAKHYRVRFSFNAIAKLKEHTWPGNIRELKNTVARAAAYFPGAHLQPDHIIELIDKPADKPQSLPTNLKSQGSFIKDLERDMIIQRLIANGGNQRRTAEELGLPKSTLNDRIKNYEIDIDLLMKSRSF